MSSGPCSFRCACVYTCLITTLHQEQQGNSTCVVQDPSGTALEFKAMMHPENLFARYFVS